MQLLKRRKKAFSLLELSIVIVIIGVLLIGVIGSKHLIKKARINSAQATTRSSPINSILNNRLWLESSLAEISLGKGLSTGDAITHWLDNSTNQNSPTISYEGSGPTYSNSINSIQAVRFDSSSNSNYLKINDASFLNNTDYTIFITEKRIEMNAEVDNYLLGESGSFAIGYESGSSIIQSHGEGSSSTNQATIESLSDYSNEPRVIVFSHSSVDGNKIYINATLANEDTSSEAKTHLSGLTELAIGKGYNGEIGEIAIFDRALKTTERKEVENYLTDKWNAPNNRDISASCTTGTVTSSGCEATCSAPNINGITSSDTINDGDTGSYDCNDTGYTGTTPVYSCASGSLSPSPDAGDCGANNGCDTGYVYNASDKTCDQPCSIIITGSSTTSISPGESTTLTCDEAGYTGSTSITYTCNSGSITPTPITTQCYDDNGCDTGYLYDATNEVCSTTCDYNVHGATTETGTVFDGNGTISCSSDNNFAGTDYSYSCTNGTPIADNCDCATGYEFNTDTESCTTALLLDEIDGTVVGAYSVRKLRTGYSGPALRLRKDGASPGESDFGFDENTDLNTAAIATWLGSDNAWVVTWYDQSGNSNNFSQSDPSLQAPYAASFGSNNRPTLDPSEDYYTIASDASNFNFTDNFTFSFAYQYDGTSSPDYIWTKNATKDIEISFSGNNFRLRSQASTLISTGGYSSSNIISQLTFDKNAESNQIKYYSNNSLLAQATRTTSFPTSTGVTYLLSNGTLTHRWGGKISEVIIYSTTLSTSDLSKIATSMSSYYGI